MQSHENMQHTRNGSQSYVHKLSQCFEITSFIFYAMYLNPTLVLYHFKNSYSMKETWSLIFISHEASMKPSI